MSYSENKKSETKMTVFISEQKKKHAREILYLFFRFSFFVLTFAEFRRG